MLYFDHNATHPLSSAARQAWLDAAERYIGNPSSPHRLGARTERALEEAREKLATWLGCKAEEIIWTSGATESVNAVLHSAVGRKRGAVWISSVEHPCAIAAADRYFEDAQERIPVSASGVADLAWLSAALQGGFPALVCLMAANNETGVLQPWPDALALCRAHGVWFFCDAAQWAGRMPLAGLGGCDFVSGSAHKFGGPPGVGFLKAPQEFHPLIVGGPQEYGRRAGTENVPGVMAMIAALEDRLKAIASGAIAERESWRDEFVRALLADVPGTKVLGDTESRLWNTVAAIMPEIPDCRQRWVVKLDKLGFAVSTGSACASGKEEPSHVLRAMGIAAAEAGRALRFSSGWETSRDDWHRLLDGVRQAARDLSS